jgi:superoxide reductase
MALLKENSVDASIEKHLPVMEGTGHVTMVKVGSIAHPMEEKHYIEWIEVVRDGKVCRKFLNPDDTPEAQFGGTEEGLEVRAYCTLHGLWKA